MSNERKKYEIDRVLITQEDIATRAAEIGRQISDDLAGEDGVLVIGILKGAVLWLSDVVKHISVPVELDFMAVSSYGAATESSGVVRILKDLDSAIDGRNVIVVEDIVDSGVTLKYLKEYLFAMRPKSLRICTLLDKAEGRRTQIEADYVGFPVENVFIVGYGLDVDQRFRNLPYIASVRAV